MPLAAGGAAEHERAHDVLAQGHHDEVGRQHRRHQPRYERHADARADHREQRAQLAHPVPWRERLARVRLPHVPLAASAGEQERVVGQVGDADARLVGQRVVGAQQGVEGVLACTPAPGGGPRAGRLDRAAGEPFRHRRPLPRTP
ncbi:hypothetical protein BBK82_30265 [Lentzea guizhouensis]|uniref:Uncharacterized protein n=1 Tax=Lentzea guizhouensis TaxID=1586287 RepID=A0A1B2HPP3_9PSEU|nr:hypothetical protein BBK82_30265 [Lentzea guizhouensis]